jgi:hypothetical protein
MKGKVNEAMASGLPVVTTTIGAEGLGARSGEPLIIADDSEGFARGVIDLLSDPERARQIGLAGQRLVGSLLSPEAIERELLSVIDAVPPRRPSPAQIARWWGLAACDAAWRSARFVARHAIKRSNNASSRHSPTGAPPADGSAAEGDAASLNETAAASSGREAPLPPGAA